MDESPWLSPPAVSPLTGQEPIVGTGADVRDFWAWSLSDLRTNTVRSLLAEFLVAQAVGASGSRVEWDAYDVLTPSKHRLEVKAAAYLQAWDQRRLSTITFGGLRSRTWSPRSGYATEPSYNADAYVFAVLTATEHDRYDALDLDQWSFWVLPRQVIAASGQASIGLARVEALAGPPVGYADLSVRVRDVLAGT